MVFLKEICLENGILKCKYAPEDSQQYGYMEVSAETGEIVKITYSDYPHGKKLYAGQARAKLTKLYKESKALPKEAVSVFF